MTAAAMLLRTRTPFTSPESGGDSSSGGRVASCLFRSRSAKFSPRPGSLAVALHHDARQGPHPLRRTRSDADLTSSDLNSLNCTRSPLPSRVLEDEEEKREDLDANLLDIRVGVWPTRPSSHPSEAVEVELSGGGIGKDSKVGGFDGGDHSENRRIVDYYQQRLRSDPSNPLLLRNYARFLHEVVGDAKAAEEYYGRAILASPGDGELLSLYGRLLWETQRDGERAEAYFERAVEASPDDSYVMGSYAKFLWDAEEEEEEEEEEVQEGNSNTSSFPLLVEAF